FPVAAGTAAKPVKAHPVPLAKNRHVLVPFAIGLIILLLIGLLLFLLWKRRNKDDDADETNNANGSSPVVPAQRAGTDAPVRR
ncbi:MAG: hypothetical protein QOJ03_2895, partial [Frankiaceae bacterium]|nr:hypothetical protein [Frankiaceae bacterium]